jgi:hypothetical protein
MVMILHTHTPQTHTAAAHLAYMLQHGFPSLLDHLWGWPRQACLQHPRTFEHAGGGFRVEEQVTKVRLVQEEGQEAAHAAHVGVGAVVCMRVRQGAMQQQQMSGSAT